MLVAGQARSSRHGVCLATGGAVAFRAAAASRSATPRRRRPPRPGTGPKGLEELLELVFHLAAQALVRDSYADPVATFATNVQGTVHVLDAIRQMPSVRAAVIVTSDKCYENAEWTWAYREKRQARGTTTHYSASKGARSSSVSSYRRSFFGEKRCTPWASQVRGLETSLAAGTGQGSTRSPTAPTGCSRARPHAAQPARSCVRGSTYWIRWPGLSARGAPDERSFPFSDATDFGPDDQTAVDVETIARRFAHISGTGEIVVAADGLTCMRPKQLRLACEKARIELGSADARNDPGSAWTVRRNQASHQSAPAARDITAEQLLTYMDLVSSAEVRA